MSGIIVIDKPAGITSSGVVSRVKKILKVRKAGHTGTLDKFATGTLPVCLNEATKAVPYLDESFKEYEATMRLGIETDTLDPSGRVVSEGDFGKISRSDIMSAFTERTGTFFQVPPMFSAVRKNGVRLSKIARLGGEVARSAKRVTVEAFDLIEFSPPLAKFFTRCSRGTYVRTLAGEIGRKLGCGAHLVQLRRTRSGNFSISESAALEDLETGNFKLTPIKDALSHMKSVRITEQARRAARSGCGLKAADLRGFTADFHKGELVKLMCAGDVVSIAKSLADTGDIENFQADESPVLRSVRVFAEH